ncbi:MAG: bifunctional alpha,alpha-trehalose-phosphate synthase (UDP-forming)/trehalose-phosphatase [Candidatus Saccharimonadales bacterium]
MFEGLTDRMLVLRENLLIVSLRLPLSVKKVNDRLEFEESSGGLATAVKSLKKSRNNLWVGWPGIAKDCLTKSEISQIRKKLASRNCIPVFLSEKQINDFYTGYSNSTIWPLFHYYSQMAEHKDEFWNGYKETNEIFAAEIRKLKHKPTKYWVHDYQLLLLPLLIRNKSPNAKIGFFLHTPFPSYEVFRIIPEREELLLGMLGADLIGFHTYDYVSHFLESTRRLLGLENKLGIVTHGMRRVRTDAFPIGINYKVFSKSSRKFRVQRIVNSLDIFNLKGKVLLAVDRADYSKGIPARLNAFEIFLRNNPKLQGKVVLILLAVPTRNDIEAYKTLRTTIEQKVSHINGEYSTNNWTPIIYRHKNLPFEELCALYSLADIMLVTPQRDGMNLVAKEFVAVKHRSHGVLILSEMAGVANEFPEAIIVNPNNSNQVASAIEFALKMPRNEQIDRLKKMQHRISTYTVEKWANDFFVALDSAVNMGSRVKNILNTKNRKQILNDYKKAKSRLILLDYDGTLKEFTKYPSSKFSMPTPRIRKVLKELSKDKNNRVVIVSGRSRSSMETFFRNMNLSLIAEHGGWIFDTERWIKFTNTSKQWKSHVRPILNNYVNRTPGAEMEEKDFSLVWHYRRVNHDLAFVRKEELLNDLKNILTTDRIGVFEGNKIVEIKPKEMHKGAQVTELIANENWDFILAIGDDYTDEDMFKVLPARSNTIKVGLDETNARFCVHTVSDVLELLNDLSESRKKI